MDSHTRRRTDIQASQEKRSAGAQYEQDRLGNKDNEKEQPKLLSKQTKGTIENAAHTHRMHVDPGMNPGLGPAIDPFGSLTDRFRRRFRRNWSSGLNLGGRGLCNRGRNGVEDLEHGPFRIEKTTNFPGDLLRSCIRDHCRQFLYEPADLLRGLCSIEPGDCCHQVFFHCPGLDTNQFDRIPLLTFHCLSACHRTLPVMVNDGSSAANQLVY